MWFDFENKITGAHLVIIAQRLVVFILEGVVLVWTVEDFRCDVVQCAQSGVSHLVVEVYGQSKVG